MSLTTNKCLYVMMGQKDKYPTYTPWWCCDVDSVIPIAGRFLGHQWIPLKYSVVSNFSIFFFFFHTDIGRKLYLHSPWKCSRTHKHNNIHLWFIHSSSHKKYRQWRLLDFTTFKKSLLVLSYNDFCATEYLDFVDHRYRHVRPSDRLRFVMEIPIPVRLRLLSK